MPKTAKEIDSQALINVIQDSFEPEHDIYDRHILHEVTGLTLADLSNSDPDIQ